MHLKPNPTPPQYLHTGCSASRSAPSLDPRWRQLVLAPQWWFLQEAIARRRNSTSSTIATSLRSAPPRSQGSVPQQPEGSPPTARFLGGLRAKPEVLPHGRRLQMAVVRAAGCAGFGGELLHARMQWRLISPEWDTTHHQGRFEPRALAALAVLRALPVRGVPPEAEVCGGGSASSRASSAVTMKSLKIAIFCILLRLRPAFLWKEVRHGALPA